MHEFSFGTPTTCGKPKKKYIHGMYIYKSYPKPEIGKLTLWKSFKDHNQAFISVVAEISVSVNSGRYLSANGWWPSLITPITVPCERVCSTIPVLLNWFMGIIGVLSESAECNAIYNCYNGSTSFSWRLIVYERGVWSIYFQISATN